MLCDKIDGSSGDDCVETTLHALGLRPKKYTKHDLEFLSIPTWEKLHQEIIRSIREQSSI